MYAFMYVRGYVRVIEQQERVWYARTNLAGVLNHLWVMVCPVQRLCLRVCVCVRERERELEEEGKCMVLQIDRRKV